MAHRLDARNLRDDRGRAGGDDDGTRAQGLPAMFRCHFNRPRRSDAGVALDHFDTQFGIALDRIVRLDLSHHVLHTRHDLAEIDVGAGVGDAKRFGFAHGFHETRTAYQRLRRHAAVVEAIAAHPVTFDQRHLGLHGGGDVSRHQPARAGANDYQITVEASRFLPAGIHLACLHDGDQLFRQKRKNTKQDERANQPRRQDAGETVDLCQLRAGIHEYCRAGEHAKLAHPIKGARLDRGEAHNQIDDEKRKYRHQTQRKQIERTVFRHPRVDGGQTIAKPALHPVTQQKARGQKRQRSANAGRERHQQQTRPQPEQRAAGQCHDCRAGQRQRGDRDVDEEIRAGNQHR